MFKNLPSSLSAGAAIIILSAEISAASITSSSTWAGLLSEVDSSSCRETQP